VLPSASHGERKMKNWLAAWGSHFRAWNTCPLQVLWLLQPQWATRKGGEVSFPF
jgi:hypothetical protein